MMRSFMFGVFSITLLLAASATASAQDRVRDQQPSQLPADNMQRPMQPMQAGQQPQPGQWNGQPNGGMYQQQPYTTNYNGGMVNQVGYTDGGCNCGGGNQGGYAMTNAGVSYGNNNCNTCCDSGRHRRHRRCCR